MSDGVWAWPGIAFLPGHDNYEIEIFPAEEKIQYLINRGLTELNNNLMKMEILCLLCSGFFRSLQFQISGQIKTIWTEFDKGSISLLYSTDLTLCQIYEYNPS